MELMQLEMFVAMVEEGTFHRAAIRVYRTQPAVSIAIKKLEEDIGSPLFDRSTRKGYTLTDTGELLYGYARRLLNLREETVAAIAELHNLQSGRLRLGANESTSLYVLPRLVQQFRAQYPKIKIEITRKLSGKLLTDLREKSIDFAILSFLPGDPDITAVPVMKDELVLIASARHPLASAPSVSIQELGGESFVAHTVRSASREKVVDAFRRGNTPLNITIEIATIETIKRFVALDLGLSFVPLMCVQEEVARGELVVIPVAGFRHERTLWLAHRGAGVHQHAAEAFIKIVGGLPGRPPGITARSSAASLRS